MSNPSTHHEILVLDFGSQYTHLIARRIRELRVFSRIVSPDISVSEVRNVAGIILSGGPQSVLEERISFDTKILQQGIPVLGLCYGHQLLAHLLGGKVDAGKAQEYGLATLEILPSKLFKGVGNNKNVWMSHGDSVVRTPDGFSTIGTTADCKVAAMADEKRQFYGLQFHPEVTHTTEGMKILKNFILDICKARQDWTSDMMLKEMEEGIKRSVGDKKVFLLVSGGVDSTVCFAILEKVLGKERVYGLHVDSGLMRYQESQKVADALKKSGFENLHVVDERTAFLHVLKGVTDPEEKRKRIGTTFLRVKEKAMKHLHLNPDHWMLAQGTIYPDTIETGRTEHADVIKTHHNRIPEIQKLVAEGKVVEPLKDLYKDEVRMIGEKLGLPHELVWRHPFPGPGLGIRILCEEESKNISSMPEAQRDELKALTQKLTCSVNLQGISSYLLPVKSVGVQGDQRSYRHPAVIVGTANIQKAGRIAPQIANSLSFVNRVMVLVSDSANDIAQAASHKAFVDADRSQLLQKIDNDINKIITHNGLYEKIWQFPVVLIPFGIDGKESIVLRPIASKEAMTVTFFELPNDILKEIVSACMSYSEISFVFYDVTNKPPATIEWE